MNLLNKLAIEKSNLKSNKVQVEKVKPLHKLTIVSTPTDEEVAKKVADEKKQLHLAKQLIADKKKKHQDWLEITAAKKPLFNKIKF